MDGRFLAGNQGHNERVAVVYANPAAAPGSKTVIPCSVKGKFSIRLVPNLTIKSVTDLVVKYVNEEFKKLGSKNRCECVLTHGGEPWMVGRVLRPYCRLPGREEELLNSQADPDHYSYRAAHKATVDVYGQEPDYTREGGTSCFLSPTRSLLSTIRALAIQLPSAKSCVDV